MTRTKKDVFELVPRKGRMLKVLPDLFEFYMEEFDWDRKDLWDHMLKCSSGVGPDISVLHKTFQTEWASRRTYSLIRKAIRKELARRYVTEDLAERIDPQKVPMPDRLDRWPKKGK